MTPKEVFGISQLLEHSNIQLIRKNNLLQLQERETEQHVTQNMLTNTKLYEDENPYQNKNLGCFSKSI